VGKTGTAINGTWVFNAADVVGTDSGTVECLTLAIEMMSPLTVGSFTPARANFGSTVVITGTNFTGTTAVKFNGRNAAYTVNSDTQITATVPPGATSGLIQVTNSQGTGSSSTNFMVNPGAVRTLGWQQVGSADFNNDGKPDLLWRNYTTGVNRVWFMNGGAYVSQADFLSVSDPTWQLVGAVD